MLRCESVSTNERPALLSRIETSRPKTPLEYPIMVWRGGTAPNPYGESYSRRIHVRMKSQTPDPLPLRAGSGALADTGGGARVAAGKKLPPPSLIRNCPSPRS